MTRRGVGTTALFYAVVALASALGSRADTAGASPAPLQEVFVVTSTDDAGEGTLRSSIEAANTSPGIDRVVVPAELCGDAGACTITLASPIGVTGSVHIEGPGASVVSISGGRTSRIFLVSEGSVTISGLTLTEGSATGIFGGLEDRGGAIHSFGANLSLLGCAFTENEANFLGGAIHFQGPGKALQIDGCTFSGNTAQGFGGAVAVTQGTFLNVYDSTFETNEALGGGALASLDASTQFLRSRVIENEARSGGGLLLFDGAHSRIRGCTIARNSGDLEGGALVAIGGTHDIEHSTIADNDTTRASGDQAPDGFAGALSFHSADVTILLSTITGNRSEADAPAISFLDVIAEIHGSTIADNTADDPVGVSAAVVADASSDVSFESCIFASGAGAPEIAARYGAMVVVTDSLLETMDAPGAEDGGTPSGTVVTTGSTIVGRDPRLAPLGDNGGPTATRALLPGSPAIDSGSNRLALLDDQRGNGFAREVNGRADMGAFEVQHAFEAPVGDAGVDGGDVVGDGGTQGPGTGGGQGGGSGDAGTGGGGGGGGGERSDGGCGCAAAGSLGPTAWTPHGLSLAVIAMALLRRRRPRCAPR